MKKLFFEFASKLLPVFFLGVVSFSAEAQPTPVTSVSIVDVAIGGFCHYASTRYTPIGSTGATSYKWRIDLRDGSGWRSVTPAGSGALFYAGDATCNEFDLEVTASNSSGDSSPYQFEGYLCTPYDVCAPIKKPESYGKIIIKHNSYK